MEDRDRALKLDLITLSQLSRQLEQARRIFRVSQLVRSDGVSTSQGIGVTLLVPPTAQLRPPSETSATGQRVRPTVSPPHWRARSTKLSGPPISQLLMYKCYRLKPTSVTTPNFAARTLRTLKNINYRADAKTPEASAPRRTLTWTPAATASAERPRQPLEPVE